MDRRTKLILVLFSIIALLTYFYLYWNQCDCKSRINYDNVDVLDGIDLNQLFAHPDSLEIEEVSRMWSNFDASSTQIKTLKTVDYFAGKQLDIISHDSEGRTHYGAIISPSISNQSEKFPVLLWGHGLNQNDPTIELSGSRFFKALSEALPNYIIVLPAYRGQVISIQGKRYCADGFFGDAYDGATDDALRLLDIIKNNYPVDLTRIATYGISRGGTVAMLSGIRDSSINCVVTQSGPMRFHNRRAYDMYNFQFRYQFLNEVKPMKELRRKLIECSPVYFANGYNKSVLILQGKNDPIVPSSNAIELSEALVEHSTLLLRDDDHFLEEFETVKEWLSIHNN